MSSIYIALSIRMKDSSFSLLFQLVFWPKTTREFCFGLGLRVPFSIFFLLLKI